MDKRVKKEQFKLSYNKISMFKTCRKKYFFNYVEKIETPKKEALQVGSNYHEDVKNILTGQKFNDNYLTKVFCNYIKPVLPEIKEVEKEFEIKIDKGLVLHGFIDAVAIDGTPIEHKTTKSSVDEKYIYRLNWNEQINTYLLALTYLNKKHVNKITYTAVQKPTIKLKQNETPEEYLKRCEEWYNDGKKKAIVFTAYRTLKELTSFKDELVFLNKEIKKCKNFYRNPNACSVLDCPYESICQDYSKNKGENNE